MFDDIRKLFQKLRRPDAPAPKDTDAVQTQCETHADAPEVVPEVPVSVPLPKHVGGRPPLEFSKVEAAMLRLNGASYRDIARKFNVSKSFVHAQIHDWIAPKPVEAATPAPEKIEAAPTVTPAPTLLAPEPKPSLWMKLEAMVAPGLKAILPTPVVEEPPVVEETQPVVTESVPTLAAPEPPAWDDDTRPIDPVEEARVDLPVRSPGRIRYLLKFESPAQTKARIENDRARYLWERAGQPLPNVQAAIVSASEKWSSKTTWVKR